MFKFDSNIGLPDEHTVVLRGAQALDQAKPDWWKRVRPEYISLKSSDWCILGQVYGDYGVGMRGLFGVYRSPLAVSHGFLVPTRRSEAKMIKWWRFEIEARRTAAKKKAEQDKQYILVA